MWMILLSIACCIVAHNARSYTGYDRITADSVNLYVEPHATAILSCNIVSRQLTNFTWLNMDNCVIENNKLWWNNETHGTMELYIETVKLKDYGTYTCKATRLDYIIYDQIYLKKFPSDVTLDVSMRTQKSITILWYFGGLFSKKWNSLIVEYRESGTKQWLREPISSDDELFGTLMITAFKRNTVYEVKGVITDRRGRNVRRMAYSTWVSTSVPRSIIARATTVVAELNERAVLSCDVEGKNITGLTWRRIENVHKKNSTELWWNSEIDVTMELEIANVTLHDNGFYECQARSSGQLLSVSSRLEVCKFDHPLLKIGAIGTDRICVIYNYTYFDDNLVYQDVEITAKYKERGTNEWYLLHGPFESYTKPATGYYVMSQLKSGTLYQIENVVLIYGSRYEYLQTIRISKWATTFEKDVEYVPTVWIVNKTMDTVTIKWSQPPSELREWIDAYLISVETGNDEDKYFRWQKHKAADGNEAVVHLQPSVSYYLRVQACFDDECPEQHASIVMKGVTSNGTASKEQLRATQKLESYTESSVLTMKVTRDSKNATESSDTSFACSVSVQGYEGWWTRSETMDIHFDSSGDGADWTIIVEYVHEEYDYTCVASMTSDSHPGGIMLVTLKRPGEFLVAETQRVHTKPLKSTALLCDAYGYRLSNFKWQRISNYEIFRTRGVSSASSFNRTHTRMMLYFANTSKSDDGNYKCAVNANKLSNIATYIHLDVSNEPLLQLNASIIGSKLVHLTWIDMVSEEYTHLMRSSQNGSFKWKNEFSVRFERNKDYNGYVVRQLTRGTLYWFKLSVISWEGRKIASTYSNWITPMGEDLSYFPNITVTLKTINSITIEWPTPPEDLRPHVRVYRISVNYTYEESKTIDVQNTTQTHFTIGLLQPSTSYDLEVKACFVDVSTDCYSSDVRRGVFTKSADEASGTQVGTYLACLGFFFLFICLGAWHFHKKARKRRIVRERLAYFYSDNPIFFNAELAISDQADLLPYEKKWEFPRKLLRLDDELGSGSFGIVWKARAKTIRRPEAVSVVAVKTVRPTASLRCMKALLRELKILIYIGHNPNIVSLLGACTKDLDYGRLLVIVEFCRFGNLHDYLWRCRSKFVDESDADFEEIPDINSDADVIDVKNHSTNSASRQQDAVSVAEDSCDSNGQPGTSGRVEDLATGSNSKLPEMKPLSKYPGDFTNVNLDPVRTQDLVSWAWQISRGMQFLASKKVLHGDLAARNVLLCEDNIVKICDFGLSKSLQDDDEYKEEGNDPLPVKWMAIESIRDGIFSVKSDVWSFGVVLWELFSLAKTPYPEINPANMCETLLGGYRMERPKYAPKTIYRTMLQCWDVNPSKRPNFAELEDRIGNLMEENVKVHYIELYTRCARAYAEITEFRNTRVPENQEPIPPDPTDPSNVSQDLVYFPNITVASKTTISMNIEWPMPPEELRAHIKLYRISVNYTYDGSEIVDFKNTLDNYYIVTKLHPSASYALEVKACASASQLRIVIRVTLREEFSQKAQVFCTVCNNFTLSA